MGVVFSVQCFTLLHIPVLGGGLGLLFCQIISMVVSVGFFIWALPQQVLLELGALALIKNSFLLFFRYILKTVSASVICLLFLLLICLMFPGSVFLLFVVGLWLPMLCVFQIIYPSLNDVFAIEETLKRQSEIKDE